MSVVDKRNFPVIFHEMLPSQASACFISQKIAAVCRVAASYLYTTFMANDFINTERPILKKSVSGYFELKYGDPQIEMFIAKFGLKFKWKTG